MTRGVVSAAKATALEILSEPLTLLVLLAALTIAVLAPAFHYHQFGEGTRMARDAGFSALFTCGSIVAVFGTIRAFRREIESGTVQMALSHPVSRGGFFVAKALGAFVAYLAFAATVFCTSLAIVEGARVGGAVAARTGDIARISGPFLVAGVAVMLLPLLLGAALNRFARCRFVLTSTLTALALAVVAGAASLALDPGLVLRYVPVAVLLAPPALVLLAASAAFAVRLAANAAAAAVGVVAAICAPAVGNYYMADALSGGGSLPWGYVGLAALCAAPAALAFVLLGLRFVGGRDVS